MERLISLYQLKLQNKSGAELPTVFAAIHAGVTSLDLSGNGLHNKSSADLAQIFAAIPNHIKTIHLGNNGLFQNKSTTQKDEVLNALGKERGRFILTHNGESDLARALAPMLSLQKEKKSL